MRPQLDPQKLAKLSTANDLLTERYGAEDNLAPEQIRKAAAVF